MLRWYVFIEIQLTQNFKILKWTNILNFTQNYFSYLFDVIIAISFQILKENLPLPYAEKHNNDN